MTGLVQVPILGGSASEWVEAIEQAGLKVATDQGGNTCEKMAAHVNEPVHIWRNDSFVAAFPSPEVFISYGIGFPQVNLYCSFGIQIVIAFCYISLHSFTILVPCYCFRANVEYSQVISVDPLFGLTFSQSFACIWLCKLVKFCNMVFV